MESRGRSSPQGPLVTAALLTRAQSLLKRRAYRPAVDLFSYALALEPLNPDAWAGAGLGMMALGEAGPALRHLRRAVSLDPRQAVAHNSIGCEMLRRQANPEALACFEAALAADPDFHLAALNAAVAEQRLGQYAQAIARMQRVVAIAPDNAAAWFTLGVSHHFGRDAAAAAEAYRKSLSLRPAHPETTFNLGRALRDLGQPEAAINLYKAAIALRPDYVQAHWNLALTLLLVGRLEEGWEEYEWRWQLDGFPSPRRGFPQPLWSGEPITGQRILLHAEQGFGDSLQFMRYVPLVAQLGGEVVLEVQPELLRLTSSLAGVTTLLKKGDPLPPFTWQAPLLSLPRALLRAGVSHIPAGAPYLRPPAEAVARWSRRLPAGGAPRVGLAWAGRPTHSNDAQRSLLLEQLVPLLDIPGLQFVSLQAGPRAADIAALGLGGRVEDLSAELTDFAETAAVLSQLDILVAVDTSVVHLAGALGRQVRVLLPFAPDWRWLEAREDSPWYPTARLLRQVRLGDWSHPIARLGKELAALARARSSLLDTADPPYA